MSIEAGMGPFTYHRNSKAMAMSYYQLPPSLYSDLGLLHDWVETSVEAARRARR
jgi:TfoX/Sxy family transcriptional regulator of competence genes